MTDDLRTARAKRAAEAHERLCKRAKGKAGQDGVTRLRVRVSEALHARMRAEQEARK